jgi:PqqD family protein of HPr-rel-A system
MEPELASRMPKVKDGITAIEIEDEAVLFDVEGAELHHLNPAATIVFTLCDGTGTVAELAADIADAFGAPVEQVEQEVGAVVETFDELGILIRDEVDGSVG